MIAMRSWIPPNAVALRDLGEERKDVAARVLAEEHATPRKLEKGRNRAELREGPDGLFDEAFIELDEFGIAVAPSGHRERR